MAVRALPYPSLELLLRDSLFRGEDPGTELLIRRLRGARRSGYLTKGELEQVCRWKSPRAMGQVRRNSRHRIRRATGEALHSRNERARLDALLALDGVSVPTASAVLMFLDPKRYGVIDIRVWQLLYALKIVDQNPRGSKFTLEQWLLFLAVIRDAAKRFGVTARAVERTLFAVHQKYQEGTLYDDRHALAQRAVSRGL